jgi:hypothetical protein
MYLCIYVLYSYSCTFFGVYSRLLFKSIYFTLSIFPLWTTGTSLHAVAPLFLTVLHETRKHDGIQLSSLFLWVVYKSMNANSIHIDQNIFNLNNKPTHSTCSTQVLTAIPIYSAIFFFNVRRKLSKIWNIWKKFRGKNKEQSKVWLQLKYAGEHQGLGQDAHSEC